ncbi:MAG: hypothetical protein ABJG28_01905, partial [Nonlabens ulvanivorans]|uniref:hypothetical protein n=1 Tax=Nonlabens ulvanivorans TaxID=906888 RepID=UPI003264BEC4
MKLRTILASSLLLTTTFTANADGFLDSIKSALGLGDQPATEQVKTLEAATTAVEDVKEEAASSQADLLGYASEQL